MARMGNRKRPYYRVVAAEEAHRRDGRFIEIVGTYDPLAKPAKVDLMPDVAIKWLSNGAQPTDTVKRLFAKAGVLAQWQAVKAGGEVPTDRVNDSVERTRPPRPSKKTATRIAEEEKAKAEAAAKPAEEAGAGA